ncbi:hypothetical protein [Streptomyces sp. NPDC059874]|uniref:hypothetical protein n=1 Tax=Streptomyces sp. NPDC059874 TaxID=3346983 RepID=UPI00364E438E
MCTAVDHLLIVGGDFGFGECPVETASGQIVGWPTASRRSGPLPPDLDQFLVLRHWLRLTLDQVDARVEQVRAVQAGRHSASAP